MRSSNSVKENSEHVLTWSALRAVTYLISLARTLERNTIFDFYAVSSEAIFSLAGQKNYSAQEQTDRGHNGRWEWEACNSCFGLSFKNNSKFQWCCQLICKTFSPLSQFNQLNSSYFRLSVFPPHLMCYSKVIQFLLLFDTISLLLSRQQGLPSLPNLPSFFSNYLLKLDFTFPKISVMCGIDDEVNK